MALFHFSAKVHGKKASDSRPRSAVMLAAYRAGENLTDTTGEVHAYGGKGRNNVLASVICMPTGSTWTPTRQELWQAVDRKNKREDAVLSREFVVSLPHELDEAQRHALAVEFAQFVADTYGVAADVSLHKPSADGDQRNFHAHVHLTANVIKGEGLGNKQRELDWIAQQRNKGAPNAVDLMRVEWANRVNAALERAGHSERVDHRTLDEQGIDRLPEPHYGPDVIGQERRTGTPSEVRLNREREQAEDAARRADLKQRAEEAARIKVREADAFARAEAERAERERLAHVASLAAASAGRRARAIEVLERASRPDPVALASRMAEVKRMTLETQAQMGSLGVQRSQALPRVEIDAARTKAHELGAMFKKLKSRLDAALAERADLPWWWWLFKARGMDSRIDAMRLQLADVARETKEARATSTRPVLEDCKAARQRLSGQLESLRLEAGHLTQQLEDAQNATKRPQERAIRPVQALAPDRAPDAPQRPRPRH